MKRTNSSAASALVGWVCLALVGCSTWPHSAPLTRYEFEEAQMGVPFRISLYARSEAEAEAAVNKAYARIAELNGIMSDYETDSEITLLSLSSEQGAPEVSLSADLWKVLEFSKKLAVESDGSFDVTVGPCTALWRKARREGELPDETRRQRALSKVGYENLVLNRARRTARLIQPGMRLDLGAVAKGYAADEALEVLRREGCPRALVAASGDLAIGSPPLGEKGWKVEITGSDIPGTPGPLTLELKDCGVATSGDLFQRLEIGGVRYSHILDPATCIGTTNRALATVIAPTCMLADAIDTTLTLLPVAEGKALAQKYRVAARLTRLEREQVTGFTNGLFERLAN